MQNFVLDAGAMIAQLAAEAGAGRVREILEAALNGQDVAVFAHVMNVCEVFYDSSRQADVLTARAHVRALEDDGLQIRSDLDATFWEDAAQIKADWKRVSLADCFGVALARRLNATFLTTDRHELEALQKAGIANIEFIR